MSNIKKFVPRQETFDDMPDKVEREVFHWKNRIRRGRREYICYSKGKEIGFIPLSVCSNAKNRTTLEDENRAFLRAAFLRHEDLTFQVLMDEIMDSV